MTERLTEGEWVLEFSSNHLRAYLDRHGEMPLPPYIKRPAPRAADLSRYQTVYAEKEGAVAAPTAGFHFTPQLFERIHAKGVMVRSVVLHVGWGTFRPVRTERIEDHQMLPEAYEVPRSRRPRAFRGASREEPAHHRRWNDGRPDAGDDLRFRRRFSRRAREAELFIYPGYRFKAVDALITNFHLPDSTPLLLACAFYASPWASPSLSLRERAPQGRVRDPFSLRSAYEEAIREGYRFYSYGDAMFIHETRRNILKSSRAARRQKPGRGASTRRTGPWRRPSLPPSERRDR